MASLIQDLNDLLEKTRGEFEAVRATSEEIEKTDPDIGRGLEDIAEAQQWSISGLYHRITQLHGTPTLLAADLSSRIAAKDALPDKLKAICSQQQSISRRVASILSRDDLDEPTRALLSEMHDLHQRNIRWCTETAKEWERDESLTTNT